MTIRILAVIAVLGLSTTAVAQDISGTPTFGSVELSTGFTPDPHSVSMAAGGSTAVSSDLGANCAGYITDAPDLDLTYNAGDTFPLNIYVVSEADTTLVVNLPDGTWICNDDAEGLNPAINLASPASGLYNIWVGNYDGTDTPPATLNISELDPQW